MKSTPPAGRWPLQDAKARFSEVVRRARDEGPQLVTVHGRDEVVVVAADEFRRLKGDRTGAALVEAMQASPHKAISLAPSARECRCATSNCDRISARHQRTVGAAATEAGS